jgi:integrase
MSDAIGGTPFAAEIEGFLKFKRGMGYKYMREEGTLKAFSRFCQERGWSGPDLTEEIVESWCAKWPHEPERGGSGHAARVAVIRQFGLYLSAMGHSVHFPMNVANGMSRRSRFVAHVLTREEVARMLSAADRICPHRRSTMHLVLPTLLRLLYSSGTRLDETLSIRMRDVNLEDGVIRMVGTKNDKVRLVALSDTMACVLREYCGILHRSPRPDDYLFCNATGGRYDKQTIYKRFRSVLMDAGIPHGGRGAGPRVHDLRHTFSCHTLMRAEEEGLDPMALLPVLSEYLGHESVRETEVYLRMTSEVYPSVMGVVERACSHVIPGVSGDAQ